MSMMVDVLKTLCIRLFTKLFTGILTGMLKDLEDGKLDGKDGQGQPINGDLSTNP